MKFKRRLTILFIIAYTFAGSVDGFSKPTELSKEALKTISDLHGYQHYEILKRTIPQKSENQTTQYMILVAANKKPEIHTALSYVQIKNTRSWKTLISKTSIALISLIEFPAALAILTGWTTQNKYFLEQGRNLILELGLLNFFVSNSNYTLQALNSSTASLLLLAAGLYPIAKIGYFTADSLLRRNINLELSWLKFFFPMGYFSHQSEVNSSMNDIQKQMSQGNQEIVLVVRKNLFDSIKAKLINHSNYTIMNDN